MIPQRTERPGIFRRRFLVKGRLQFHFALAAFVLILLSTGSVWFLMDIALERLATHNTGELGEAAHWLLKAHGAVWFFILADAVAVFVLSLFFSHYVAGPVYRLEKAFVEMASGSVVAPVRFRKNDPMHDTARTFNDAAMRWSRLKREHDEMRSFLRKLSTQMKGEKLSDQTRVLASEVDDKLDSIERAA